MPATKRSLSVACLILFLSTDLLSSTGLLGAEEPPIDFNRDIRPILSGVCVACHGPDESSREAGLRLDRQADATADLGGYAAIVPGDAESSELLVRIESEDEDMRMPPPQHGSRLSATQVDLIRRWINAGGKYDKHWAYVKPHRSELPSVQNTAWPNGPIDQFILAELEKRELAPSQPANRNTIARRVALSLTGLPPSDQELSAFINDTDPDAYEKYVDVLLWKPAFGERWGRVWLDLARYADSAGYADDPSRTIWAYRDYVIRALNENKPFDQFTVEQIAGDSLDSPTDDQLVATAFHRNTMTNNEGGTNDEQFRNEAIIDRVNTTFAVWMGTTMACAQCHTHKYDPITHEEYFQVFDIFNQSQDADRRDESPVLELWSDEQTRRKSELRESLAKLKQEFTSQTPLLDDALATWKATLAKPPVWKEIVPEEASSSEASLSVDASGRVKLAGSAPATAVYQLSFPIEEVTKLAAIQLQIAESQTSNFVLSHLSASFHPEPPTESVEANLASPQEIRFTEAVADYSQPNFPAKSAIKVLGDGEKPSADTGWAIGGSLGKHHVLTLLLDAPIELERGRLSITLSQTSKFANHVLTDFRLAMSDNPNAQQWADIPDDVKDLLEKPELTDAENQRLAVFHRSVTPLLTETRRQIAELEKSLAEMKPETSVPVMRDFPEDQRRKSFVQIRGNYQSLGKQVFAGVPKVFQESVDQSSEDQKTAEHRANKMDRLAFAKWLVDRENPLTARVIVNRHWEQIFGTGIVETSEEFGSQGDLPTHPKLLDWLAVDFMESGWDLKRLLKQMVISNTYRQTSDVTSQHLAADPDNRFYARGPRFRVSAEIVRDQSLAVAGLLSDKLYGPPVRPPQPQLGLTAAFGSGTDWQTSAGEDRYRRGIYTTWRRSNPYPSMATFDAPNREVCTLRRSRTNTPLQALVTMNDPVFVEAAQGLARRMADDASDAEKSVDSQITAGIELALLRKPTDAELRRLVDLYQQLLQVYKNDIAAAAEIAEQPLGPLPEGVDRAHMAALTVVSNVILNLDEFLMPR